MLVDGHYVDGSWLLKVHIDDLCLDREVRVQGDWSVGELIAELTNGLTPPVVQPPEANEMSLISGPIRTGWSHHRLWWPAKVRWITLAHASLNQYGLQADAWLRFVSVHGRLRIQLPDLQTRELVNVNYAEPVFRVVVSICRQLNIRHPEELSLAHPIKQKDLKSIPTFVDRRQPYSSTLGKRTPFQRSATISTTHPHIRDENQKSTLRKETNNAQKNGADQLGRKSSHSSRTSEHLFGPPRLRDKQFSLSSYARYLKTTSLCLTKSNQHYSPGSMQTLAFELRTLQDPFLTSSPQLCVEDAYYNGLIVRPSSFVQRLRLNTGWLDSARSLMEQGIDVNPTNSTVTEAPKGDTLKREEPTGRANADVTQPQPATLLCLRFKYGTFYDLNSKYDSVRINQLYEQAKWSVLSEVHETTEDEACLLAALQAHVEIASEQEERTKSESERLPSMVLDELNDVIDATVASVNASQENEPGQSQSRDASPIGGYLRHSKNPKQLRQRPLSTVQLESQIDAMLEELEKSSFDQLDTASIVSGSQRSRSRQRSARPLSLYIVRPSEEQEPAPPSLRGHIRICKHRKLSLKLFRRFFVTVDGLKLMIHKGDQTDKPCSFETIYLPGCEVRSDLCISSGRYTIRLFVPITRTNLPLAAAFGLNKSSDESRGDTDEEITVGGRIRRRASLLSLTSLSHFGQLFGLLHTGASGGIGGPFATALGLMNELLLQFKDSASYTDWLAYLRLATAVSPSEEHHMDTKDALNPQPAPGGILTASTYDAEHKAINGFIQLISPTRKKEETPVDTPRALEDRLEHRFADFMPMRICLGKSGSIKSPEPKRGDQPGINTDKTRTLTSTRLPNVPSFTGPSGQVKANLTRRIAVSYERIKHLTPIQAKLKYISAWEQLPNHGVVYFPARFEITLPLVCLLGEEQTELYNPVPWVNKPAGGGTVTISNSRRLEAVGLGPTRIFRCDVHTGDILASWRLSSIQSWHINWELNELVLVLAINNTISNETGQRSCSPASHANDRGGRVIIRPVDVPVQKLAEFLGGYTFLNLRSPEKNQFLDESVFYKLTTRSAMPLGSGIAA